MSEINEGIAIHSATVKKCVAVGSISILEGMTVDTVAVDQCVAVDTAAAAIGSDVASIGCRASASTCEMPRVMFA